jgi:hypothetical protein
MMARLVFRRTGSDRLSLSIPLRVRILPALVSAWLLFALTGVGDDSAAGPHTVALVLFCLSAAAALYDDRWIFEHDERRVVHRLGLLFAARETAIAMDDLRCVIVTGRLARGGRGDDTAAGADGRAGLASYAMLALEDRTGRVLRLEQYRGSRAAALRVAASEIASFCGVPFEDRRA